MSEQRGNWGTMGLFAFLQSQKREIMQGRSGLALERRFGTQAQAREVGVLKKGVTRLSCAKVLQNGTQDLEGKSCGGIGT